MVDYARTMLDRLLGPDRNNNQRRKLDFWDESVCKCFLVDFCPHDLFINTKSDIGPCPKIHDDQLKEEYQESLKNNWANENGETKNPDNYEYELFVAIEMLVRDLDRKIRRGRERVEHKGDDKLERMMQITKDERIEKMVIVEEQIKRLQEQIDECAMQKLVDEARDLATEVDTLQSQLVQLKKEEQEDKKMEACEVCGALLIINDATDRVIAHLEGKQHTGYKKLREKYDQLKEKYRTGAPDFDPPPPLQTRGRNPRDFSPPPSSAASYERSSRDDFRSGGRDYGHRPPPSRDGYKYPPPSDRRGDSRDRRDHPPERDGYRRDERRDFQRRDDRRGERDFGSGSGGSGDRRSNGHYDRPRDYGRRDDYSNRRY
jgi:hypothetical protein